MIFLLVIACEIALAAEPKRVMLLHSLGREFRPWNVYANTIRTELGLQSPWALDVIEHSLITARFRDDDSENAFVEYLRALYAKHPLNLIICLGAPAVDFVQRHRHELFASTPMLFTSVAEPLIGIAGLVRDAPGIGEAFTMLTTEPGPDVAPYHGRQIAVLRAADWHAWLDYSQPANELLRPLPAGSLEVSQVVA